MPPLLRMLLFDPDEFFETLDEDGTCEADPFELMLDMDIALCFSTGEDGADDEKLPPGDSLPPVCADSESRFEAEFFILCLMSR
jgi:hypothetical protein